jgi:organic radical activating enzyme
MLDQLTGFHIEPTNICTLKCPRCARTKFIEQFPRAWRNHQLSVSVLDRFMDIDLAGKEFDLCGNTGDPIYYDQLFELIQWIHDRGARVHITTNGSYRTAEWWATLAMLLTEKDSVAFSVDGLPGNFTQYRVNADWTSIELGMLAMCNSPATTQWKYIPFAFNENDIESARELSQQLGIDQFIITPSDRWDEEDSLRPTAYVGAREHPITLWHKQSNIEIDPLCKKVHNQHYISAEGFYMPCCYVGDYRFYYKSEFHKNKSQYDISKNTISEILTTTQNFYNSIEQTAPSYCTYNCPRL